MNVRELVKELRAYPPDCEVMIEVHGREGWAVDVDWESGGVSSWVKIHDYPTPTREERDAHYASRH